jgi:uncharacterized membrane protein YeaQ/YmgE (transglycosylase-associated protein family)
MSSIIIWFIIWVVVGLLVGALASIVTKSEPPYGLAIDLVVSVLAMVIMGLGDFYLLPLLGVTGVVYFLGTLLEPLFAAVLALWLLRVIKRRRSR